jgi:hypothetical protein
LVYHFSIPLCWNNDFIKFCPNTQKVVKPPIDYMELVRIFSLDNNVLLSIKFDEHDLDEFHKAFDQWQDVAYLEDFFETHQSDLQSAFYGKISVEDAVWQTIEDSRAFENQLRNGVKAGAKYQKTILNDEIFKPLEKLRKTISLYYEENKAYGFKYKSWLRLYAIRISATIFVVSGSAIKLTKAMQDRAHTQKELQKLKMTAQYLKEIGFQDDYDYGYIDIQDL